jgi:hypothetical protein
MGGAVGWGGVGWAARAGLRPAPTVAGIEVTLCFRLG